MKVTENVLDHQLNRYARSKGKDPDNLTVPEKEELKTQMINELYPGKDL